MGRWLKQIGKYAESIPTKLTKPGFVSFVGTIPGRFQDQENFESIKKITSNNEVIKQNKKGFVSFVSTVPELKRALHQGRLEVFRILLRSFLNDSKCRAIMNYQGGMPIDNKAVEDYLDLELVNFDYDLELMIDMYRHYAPIPNRTPSNCLKCGYNLLFCGCKTAPTDSDKFSKLIKETENE